MKNKEKRKKTTKLWVKGFIEFAESQGYATLATWLGYKDSSAIRNWTYRKSIPYRHVETVKKLMEKYK